MNRQQEYAQLEAELIAKRGIELTKVTRTGVQEYIDRKDADDYFAAIKKNMIAYFEGLKWNKNKTVVQQCS